MIAIGSSSNFANAVEYEVNKIRLTVLHKAARVKTPATRAIIKQMTTDAYPLICQEAIRYERELSKDN